MSKIKANPEAWMRTLDDMIESGEYVWAEETLKGIRDYVKENELITAKQTKAILNIRRSTQ